MAQCRAARASGNYPFALAGIDPLTGYDFPHTLSQMQGYKYRSQTQTQIEDENEDESEDQTADTGSIESNGEMETQDSNLAHIPAKGKAEVASGVGLAFDKTGDLSHPLDYFRIHH